MHSFSSVIHEHAVIHESLRYFSFLVRLGPRSHFVEEKGERRTANEGRTWGEGYMIIESERESCCCYCH